MLHVACLCIHLRPIFFDIVYFPSYLFSFIFLHFLSTYFLPHVKEQPVPSDAMGGAAKWQIGSVMVRVPLCSNLSYLLNGAVKQRNSEEMGIC